MFLRLHFQSGYLNSAATNWWRQAVVGLGEGQRNPSLLFHTIPQPLRHRPQPPIPRPQPNPRRQPHRRQQMRIHKPNPQPKQPFRFNKPHHLRIHRNSHPRQRRQIPQHLRPIGKIPQRQFAQHKRMHQHQPLQQQSLQPRLTPAKMLNPNRAIRQNHARSARRRGTSAKSGSLPPSRASRRAASRCTSAVSASRTSADFSIIPV